MAPGGHQLRTFCRAQAGFRVSFGATVLAAVCDVGLVSICFIRIASGDAGRSREPTTSRATCTFTVARTVQLK
jgi:hypothetical protein